MTTANSAATAVHRSTHRLASTVTASALSAVLGLGLLLAGCATTSPAAQTALAQAHSEVETLEADPLASQSAGKPLQDARDALAAADQAAREHRDNDVIHLSYLAKRRAEVGEAVLAEARARTELSQAQAKRNAVLIQERDREANSARALAQASADQAAVATAQAAQSQAEADATRAQLEALQAKQTDRGMVVTLNSNVLFDTGRDTVKPGAEESLARVAQFMQSHNNVKVRIEGHTDSVGSDDYNDALSQRRADAVAHALESQGVDQSHILAVGRGKSLPVASNDTAEGRQQNRRVDIVFSDSQGTFASVH